MSAQKMRMTGRLLTATRILFLFGFGSWGMEEEPPKKNSPCDLSQLNKFGKDDWLVVPAKDPVFYAASLMCKKENLDDLIALLSQGFLNEDDIFGLMIRSTMNECQYETGIFLCEYYKQNFKFNKPNNSKFNPMFKDIDSQVFYGTLHYPLYMTTLDFIKTLHTMPAKLKIHVINELIESQFPNGPLTPAEKLEFCLFFLKNKIEIKLIEKFWKAAERKALQQKVFRSSENDAETLEELKTFLDWSNAKGIANFFTEIVKYLHTNLTIYDIGTWAVVCEKQENGIYSCPASIKPLREIETVMDDFFNKFLEKGPSREGRKAKLVRVKEKLKKLNNYEALYWLAMALWKHCNKEDEVFDVNIPTNTKKYFDYLKNKGEAKVFPCSALSLRIVYKAYVSHNEIEQEEQHEARKDIEERISIMYRNIIRTDQSYSDSPLVNKIIHMVSKNNDQENDLDSFRGKNGYSIEKAPKPKNKKPFLARAFSSSSSDSSEKLTKRSSEKNIGTNAIRIVKFDDSVGDSITRLKRHSGNEKTRDQVGVSVRQEEYLLKRNSSSDKQKKTESPENKLGTPEIRANKILQNSLSNLAEKK